VLRRLAAHGEVGFTELAEEFGVSEMTIRRDLETLEADGLARRVRGGAISVVSRSYEPPLTVRATTASAAKAAIGAAAAGLVNDGDTVIIDVGTTTSSPRPCRSRLNSATTRISGCSSPAAWSATASCR